MTCPRCEARMYRAEDVSNNGEIYNIKRTFYCATCIYGAVYSRVRMPRRSRKEGRRK